MQVAQRPPALEPVFQRNGKEQCAGGKHRHVHRSVDPHEQAGDLVAHLRVDHVRERQHDRAERRQSAEDGNDHERTQQHVRPGDQLRLALRLFGNDEKVVADPDQSRTGKTLRDPLLEPADGVDDLRCVERLIRQGSLRTPMSAQSRSSSLMLVLARVFSSTCLTMTAQAWCGPAPPFFPGLPGRLPGTTTE